MYADPLNYHRHKCHFCDYIWDHHDINDKKHGDGGAHECPKCGRCNWSLGVYEGDLAPQSRNGNDPGGAVISTIHPDQQKRSH